MQFMIAQPNNYPPQQKSFDPKAAEENKNGVEMKWRKHTASAQSMEQLQNKRM